tara:strand:- start:480 stop:668 length:189 start_codon:yes stop_codon:yes gene_type:complete
MTKKLKFKDRDIFHWKSDFSPGPKSKSGKPKERAYTQFKGEKHFILIYIFLLIIFIIKFNIL